MMKRIERRENNRKKLCEYHKGDTSKSFIKCWGISRDRKDPHKYIACNNEPKNREHCPIRNYAKKLEEDKKS